MRTSQRWNGMQTERKTRGTKGKESRMSQKMEETVYVYSAGPARRINIQCAPFFHHAVSRQGREAKYGKGGEICPSISIKRKRRGSHLRVFMPERLKVALEGILAFEACAGRGESDVGRRRGRRGQSCVCVSENSSGARRGRRISPENRQKPRKRGSRSGRSGTFCRYFRGRRTGKLWTERS